MRRLLTAITIGALGAGLIAAPIATAAPASAENNGVDSTIIRYGDRIQFSTNACIQPGTKDEYRVLVTASPTDSRVDNGYVELVEGTKRTRVASKFQKLTVKKASGEVSTEIIAAAYTFSNPKGLSYQVTVDGFASKVFAVIESPTIEDDEPIAKSPESTVAAKKYATVSGWKSSKARMNTKAAKRKIVTVTNPQGRTLTVQQKVGGKWKSTQTTRLNNASKQKVAIKTTDAVRKAGTHKYRIILSESKSYKKTVKNINVKSIKAKQKTKVKVAKKGKSIIVKVSSTQKVPAKVFLQKKFGKGWSSVETKKSSKASAKFKAPKIKGTYRVVVKATKKNATTGVVTFRVR